MIIEDHVTDFDQIAVSRWDRLLIFGGLNLGALACFVICFFLITTLTIVVRPSKFATL